MGWRRWTDASRGVTGLLLLLLFLQPSVRKNVFALNDSGTGEDHNVLFLHEISGISDIVRKDNILNTNRTSDSVNNSISNSSEVTESDYSDNITTEVPMSTSDTDEAIRTSSAENNDETVSPEETTLISSFIENDSVNSLNAVTTSEHDENMLTTVSDEPSTFDGISEDLATISQSANDFTEIAELPTDIFSETESSQEVSTVDAENVDYFVRQFDGCELTEDECVLTPVESDGMNSSSLKHPLDSNRDETSVQIEFLHSPSSSLVPMADIDTEVTVPEVATLQTTSEIDSDTVLNISSVVAVKPVITITKTGLLRQNSGETIGFVTEAPENSVTNFDLDVRLADDYYNDEYDLIVETLISTATMYYDDKSLQNLETSYVLHSESQDNDVKESSQNYDINHEVFQTVSQSNFNEDPSQDLETSTRVVRSVSQNHDATPYAAYNHDASNQYRGFLSEDPSSLKTFMTVNSEAAFERRKSQRKSDPEPDIDDIIKGIVQLLGGNVKVTAAEEIDTRLTTFGNLPHSSRINNRGPPRLSQVPFGVLNSAVLTRPPIRPPVTPPASIPNLRPLPGMPPGNPQFVANTRPPFLAPLPPSLASRPSPPIQKPYETGVPIPEDLLPESGENAGGTTIIPLNPLFTDHENKETSNTGISSSVAHSSTLLVDSSSVSLEETVIETTTLPTESSISLAEEGSSVLSTETEEIKSTSQIPTSVPELSTTVLSTLINETSTTSDFESSVLGSSTVLIAPTPVTEEEQMQTSMLSSISSASSQTLLPSVESSTSNPLSSTATPPLQIPTSVISSQSSHVLQASSTTLHKPPANSFSRPRPGVVLDDSNYRPGQIITGTVVPFDTGPGDVFDVTVSAYQDFGGGGSRPIARPPSNSNLGQPYIIPVDPHGNEEGPLITTPVGGDNGFVSIDGRKTYFDLFPTATQSNVPVQDKTVGTGVGVVIPEEDVGQGSHGGFYQVKPLEQKPPVRPRPTQPPTSPPTQPPKRPTLRQPSFNRRPTQPPIRIDTCIVGDDSTCQEQLSEVCRTEEGVSSCYCKPGTARKRPRTPCKRVVSLRVSVKVDRVGDQRIVWSGNYGNPESEEYRLLEWESHLAISNAMSKTRLGSAYLGNNIHKFYSLGGKVIVNSTIHLEENPTTRSRKVLQMVQKEMIQVIRSHSNNIGDSALYVSGPLNPIPDVSDVNECNDPSLYDCHADATCINEFGTFTCRCLPGYTDRFSDDPEQVGRKCQSCSSDYCNKRGDCRIEAGQKVCECIGSYYGTRCEIDGEVLGVAVGASVAAVVIIILTLIFLCMWSRRWKAQDRKTEVLARGAAAAGATLGGGFSVNVQHKGTLQPNQYGVSLEDRMRWAQIAESIGNQNIYAQPEHLRGTMGGPTAPPTIATTTPTPLYKGQRQMAGSSSGYASLGTLGSTTTGQFSHQTHEQFGLQHMNPVNPLASLQHQQQQHYQKQQAFGAQSTYGQYGPASYTGMSQSGIGGGVSRAPTLGARTPLPMHEGMGGAATIGPMGGASVAAKSIAHSIMGASNMGIMESSEEEMDRPYQLPRPKSRGSLAVGTLAGQHSRIARSYNSLLF